MKDFDQLNRMIAEHHAKGRSRITLKVPGFSREEVIAAWNEQTRGLVKPAVKVGPRGGPDPDEDGFHRLVRKKRLTDDQMRAGKRLRDLAKLAELAGGPAKSCLDIGVGGGSGSGLPVFDGEADSALAAKRELFRLRWAVLKGEPEMRLVLDGVIIAGHTLIKLAGGDQSRSRELEAVLRVALNMLHLDLHPAQAEAA